MTYKAAEPFNFSNNGHANRRDPHAEPRVLAWGLTFDSHEFFFHIAGDEFLRFASLSTAVMDAELIAGMEPIEAMRLGIEYGNMRAYEGGLNE